MIGALCPATQRAEEKLKQGKIGDEIDEAMMSDVIGRDCSGPTPGAANVRTAIRRVRLNDRIWWERVRGEKRWRCLGEAERVESQKRAVRLLAKRARRHARESCAINPDSLDATTKVDYLTNQVQFAVIMTGAGAEMRKRLAETRTLERMRQPELPQLIELMSNGTRRDATR